jgi:hypothetical protein
MREALRRRAGIVEKRMFGGICWMLRGNMLCGVWHDGFLFRVGPDQQPEALARPGATPMEITGRPMRGFVLVGADEAIDAGLEAWIAFAMRFVGGLPPKAPRALARP